MKSRAKRMLETTLREDSTDLQAQPQGTAGPSTAAGGEPGGSMAPASPQPTDNDTKAAELQQLVAENCADPDGMHGMADAQHKMMDKYMDQDDDSCYTPGSEEEKEACEAAKHHFGEAAMHMARLRK
jgi:hypothetical protein